jgi:hypothetical protein
MAETTADDLAQGRLTKVFKFLKELNELRNPVPRDMSGYSVVHRIDTWPRHPCIEVFRDIPLEEDKASDSDDDAKAIPLICIKRAPLVSILHPYESRVYPVGAPLRLIAAVNTHVGAKNPKLTLKWQVDGKSVGEGLECWIDAPKRGRHKCRVVAKDDGGESEAMATFITRGAA